MKPTCEICGTPADQTLNKCTRGYSVTSDSRLTKTVASDLFHCAGCDYFFTRTEFGQDGYYDEAYSLLLDDFEQDQMLFLSGGEPMLRNSYQAKLLHDLILDLPVASACDIGCGKGLTTYHFLKTLPALQLALYDPGHAIYAPFWQAHLPSARPITDLQGDTARFDLVYSFFAAEHVPDLTDFVSDAVARLTDTGVFVAALPDLEQNYGDLLVSDHLRHLSLASAEKLIARLAPPQMRARVWRDGPLRAIFFAIGAPDTVDKLNVTHEGNAQTVQQPELSAIWPIERRDEILQQIGSRKVILWGGSFFARVVDLTLDLDIAAMVDSNPHFQGAQFDMLSGQTPPIQPPASLDGFKPEEIVIIPCMTPQASGRLVQSMDEKLRASVLRIFV